MVTLGALILQRASNLTYVLLPLAMLASPGLAGRFVCSPKRPEGSWSVSARA